MTALDNGFKLKQTFDAVRAITAKVDTPVLVMTYWNPVMQYGVDRYADDLLAAGGAGLITPDITDDELFIESTLRPRTLADYIGQVANEVARQSPPAQRPAHGLALALTVFHEPLVPPGLTRERLHALARVQARFSAGWVSLCLIGHFMDMAARFGTAGLTREDAEWLHAFVRDHGLDATAHGEPETVLATLQKLFGQLVTLGLDADQVAQTCTQLLRRVTPA